MANARAPKIREKAVKSRVSKIAKRGALGVLLRGCASCRGVGGHPPILNFALFVKFRVGMLLAAGSWGLRLGLWLALAGCPILNFVFFAKFRVGMLLAAGSSGLRLGLWLALALEIEPGAPS